MGIVPGPELFSAEDTRKARSLGQSPRWNRPGKAGVGKEVQAVAWMADRQRAAVKTASPAGSGPWWTGQEAGPMPIHEGPASCGRANRKRLWGAPVLTPWGTRCAEGTEITEQRIAGHRSRGAGRSSQAIGAEGTQRVRLRISCNAGSWSRLERRIFQRGRARQSCPMPHTFWDHRGRLGHTGRV